MLRWSELSKFITHYCVKQHNMSCSGVSGQQVSCVKWWQMAAGLHLIKAKKGKARKAYRASSRGSSLIDLLPAQPLQITLSSHSLPDTHTKCPQD